MAKTDQSDHPQKKFNQLSPERQKLVTLMKAGSAIKCTRNDDGLAAFIDATCALAEMLVDAMAAPKKAAKK